MRRAELTLLLALTPITDMQMKEVIIAPRDGRPEQFEATRVHVPAEEQIAKMTHDGIKRDMDDELKWYPNIAATDAILLPAMLHTALEN
jgi:hypothetical protein